MLALPSAAFSAAAGEAGRATEQLQTVAEKAARRNLRVAVEASPNGPALRTAGDVWALVQRAKHPHLGLLLDSYQVLSTGEDLGEIRDNPGNRIFFVRVGDARRPGWDGVRGGFHRNFPGQGDLDLVGFLEQVLFTGYAGTLSLASFDDVLRGTPSRRTGIDGMRALLLSRKPGARPAPAGERRKATAARPPTGSSTRYPSSTHQSRRASAGSRSSSLASMTTRRCAWAVCWSNSALRASVAIAARR